MLRVGIFLSVLSRDSIFQVAILESRDQRVRLVILELTLTSKILNNLEAFFRHKGILTIIHELLVILTIALSYVVSAVMASSHIIM